MFLEHLPNKSILFVSAYILHIIKCYCDIKYLLNGYLRRLLYEFKSVATHLIPIYILNGYYLRTIFVESLIDSPVRSA